MRAIHGREVGFSAAAGFALALAACGSSGGGGGDPVVETPGTATPEFVSLTSEGGTAGMGVPPGAITVSAAATFADGSFVRVGIWTEWTVFAPGEPNERRPTPAGPGPYIARYDADGALRWVRFCWTNSPDPAPPSDVIAMPDGSAIFTGRRADLLLFENGPGGVFALDRGVNGSYTTCYDASGTLRFARESMSSTWDAKLAVAAGGDEYAMLVNVQNEIAIAPDEGSPGQFEVLDHALAVVARFRSDNGDFVDWRVLDAGAGGRQRASCSTTDGGFAVAGNYTDPVFLGFRAPDGGEDSYVLRFGVDAKLVWKARITSTTLETIEAVAGTPDGGVFATGLYVDSCTFTGATRNVTLPRPAPIAVHVQRADPLAASRWLCAWDAEGEVLWARVVASTFVESSSVVRLAAAADGSIALVDSHRESQTIDPDGAAYAVPAAASGACDTLLLRWSPTGVLRNVGRLVGDPTAEVTGLCPQPAGGWLVFMTGAGEAVYDPEGPTPTSAPLRGLKSAFTLRLRTP